MTRLRRDVRQRNRMPRYLRAVERAAKRGGSFAQYNLGAHPTLGEEVEQDLKRAVFWYRKAAAQKEPEAVYNLGLMHMTGEGVVTDVRREMKMLERAAELGSPDAQQFLGDVLVAGAYGTSRDPERAAYYYLRSFAGGYPRSALLLSIALERRGKISRTQLISALIRVAAEGGVKAAQPMLSARAVKGRKK